MSDGHSRWVAAAFAVACVLYLLVPEPGREAVVAGISLLALGLGTRGVVQMPRGARRSWGLVVAGLAVLAGAQTLEAVSPLLGPDPVLSGAVSALPGAVSALPEAAPGGAGGLLLDALGALLLAAGVLTVVGRPRLRDVATSIDGLIIATTVGTVLGVLVVHPAWAPMAGPRLGPLPLVAHSGAHLALLMATVGLLLVAPWRRVGTRLLTAGVLALLFSAGATLAHVVGGAATTAVAGVAAMGAPLLVALAARHPSAHDLTSHPVPERVADAPWRVVVLTSALLLLPLTALAHVRTGVDIALAAVTALLVLLLMARFTLLLRELQASRARELVAEQQRSHRRLETLVRHASDALLVLGHGDRITYATPAATGLFGTDPTGWTSSQLLDRVHPDDRDATHRVLLESLLQEDGRPLRLQARLFGPEDGERHVEVVAVDLTTDPDVGGTVLTLQDISDRVELERRLRHLAFHDALTGLSNREVLQDRLSHALGRAGRTGQPLAVLLCDLDDFKDVNDTHGHAVGDRLLVAVAERLRGAARSTDTVARLGGDEFAILCEGIRGHRDAIEIARRVLAAAEEPVQIDGRTLRAGVSIGIAVDDGRRSGQDLLRDADIALYEAKADGKQRWSVHRRRMTERAHARLQLASDLGAAVEAGRIEVAFQPIVRLADGQVTGVESLARWEHPEHGWVPPSQFIPLAEETGQIIPLGDIVLRTAMSTLARWREQDPALDLRVGVNVSARQVRDRDLPGRVASWLAEFGLDPARLVLELTESVMLDEADDAIEVMQHLRELGVRFAVDDFGTGYSSLAYLRRLPVDIVKTDRAFVRELGRDDASADLVRAVVEMARSLRLDVVAEGVEDLDQHDALVEMGCGFAQGYHFARPMAAEALLPRLREGSTRQSAGPERLPLPTPATNGLGCARSAV